MKLHEIPLKSLPKTAPRTITLMGNLGIHTYQDLIDYFPYRYEDYSNIVHIADMANFLHVDKEGVEESFISQGKVTLKTTIEKFDSLSTRRGITIQKVRVSDDSGSHIVTLFNQPYLRSISRIGATLQMSGSVKMHENEVSFQMEEYELIGDGKGSHTGCIVPVYQQTRGLSSKTIREKILSVLKTYPELVPSTLPDSILEEFGLNDDAFSYAQIHFPENVEKLKEARYRKAFDEFFCVQLSSHLIKKEWQKEHVSFKVKVDRNKLGEIIAKLPFTLTKAQAECLEEILYDFEKTVPMNRLLQGDVGSGKTIVALLASYMAHLNGLRTLIMAPTEILAQQHNNHFKKMFELLPEKERPTIALYTRLTKKDAEKADIVIGTHALIAASVSMENVGFVIVDEQHKFGVAQRAALKSKGMAPHMLSMTATPIPRTVLLTLYGELDISTMKEKPAGRLEIKTYPVPPQKRHDAYAWIEKEIREHSCQAFLVCPLIEASESETLQDVKAATVEFEHLQRDVFPDLKLGLLHGRMKKDEKEAMMLAFKEGELDILISTPVVEVGIDIPNARIIVIEAAERFGLAQLHQLRGRVGRSDKQSHCLLFSESASPKSLARLRFFSHTHDGFALAEYDLQNRGGGSVYGTAQHGMDSFKVAEWTDSELIEKTRKAAEACIRQNLNLDEFPELKRKLEKYQIEAIAPN